MRACVTFSGGQRVNGAWNPGTGTAITSRGQPAITRFNAHENHRVGGDRDALKGSCLALRVQTSFLTSGGARSGRRPCVFYTPVRALGRHSLGATQSPFSQEPSCRTSTSVSRWLHDATPPCWRGAVGSPSTWEGRGARLRGGAKVVALPRARSAAPATKGTN